MSDRAVNGARHGGFHFHGAQHHHGVSGLDVLPGLARHVDDLAGHRGADASLVARVGLLLGHAERIPDGNALLHHLHHPGQAVQLEEDLPAPVCLPVPHGLEDDLGLDALAHVEHDLLVRLERPEEGLGGKDGNVAVLLLLLVVVVKDLRVQRPGDHVQLAHGLLAVLVHDLALLDGKVEGLHVASGPARHRGLPLEHPSPQLLREPPRGLAQVALEVLHHTLREIELWCEIHDGVLGELVLDDELGEVPDHLAGWGDLDNVPENLVSHPVGALNLLPLLHQTILHGLELQVRVLAARHLVLVDLGAPRPHATLKLAVLRANLLPVRRKPQNPLRIEARVQVGALEGVQQGAHAGLGSHAAHAVAGAIHHVGPGLRGGDHARDSHARRVVGVHVDGHVRELPPERGDQHLRGRRLEQTGHVLNSKDVDPSVHELPSEVEVVVQVVLWPRGVGKVGGVADGALRDSVRLQHSLNSEEQVVDVVQRVEDPEDVHAGGVRLLDELLDEVVRVGRVPDRVDAPQQHLEGNVRDLGPELLQPLPGALVQEPHGDVKGSPAPHLEAHAVLQRPRGVLRAAQEVVRPDPCRKQTLMGVPHGGVREQQTLVRPKAPRELGGPLLQQQGPPSPLADLVPELEGHPRDHGVRQALWVLPNRPWMLGAVHGGVGEVAQELGGQVRGEQRKVEELRGGLDQRGVCGAAKELGVLEDVHDEGHIGPHTPHPELREGAL